MLKIKKIWLFLVGITAFFGFNLQYVRWLPVRDHNNTWSQGRERYSDPQVNNTTISDTDPIWSWSKLIWDKSVWILHLPQPIEYATWLGYALALIQYAINRILGMLSVVTLVFIIYNWFLILSSGADSKNAANWKKWIITAGIAIAWIAISWLIISVILRLIKSFV